MRKRKTTYLKTLIVYLCLSITFPFFGQSESTFFKIAITTNFWIPIIIFGVAITLLGIFNYSRRLKKKRDKKIADAIETVKNSIATPTQDKLLPTKIELIDIDKEIPKSPKDEWLEILNKNAQIQIENKKFSIVELASSMNLSERQFRRKLKQKTGLLPVAFMRELRLIKAKELLLSGAFPTVALVCYEVGFSTPKHFSKLFLERFGKNPSFYLENKSDA